MARRCEFNLIRSGGKKTGGRRTLGGRRGSLLVGRPCRFVEGCLPALLDAGRVHRVARKHLLIACSRIEVGQYFIMMLLGRPLLVHICPIDTEQCSVTRHSVQGSRTCTQIPADAVAVVENPTWCGRCVGRGRLGGRLGRGWRCWSCRRVRHKVGRLSQAATLLKVHMYVTYSGYAARSSTKKIYCSAII